MELSRVIQFSREESQIIKRAANHIGIIKPTEEEAKTIGGVLAAGNMIREHHLISAITTFRKLLRQCELDQCTKPDPEWVKRNIKALEEGRVTLIKDPVDAVAVIHESRAMQAEHVQAAIDLLDVAGRAMHGEIRLS